MGGYDIPDMRWLLAVLIYASFVMITVINVESFNQTISVPLSFRCGDLKYVVS